MEQSAAASHAATPKKSFFSSTRIAYIAMFGTIAGILYILNFSLSFAFPSFLEFNFSDVPVLIGTFTLGPVSGSIIVAVKILIKLAVKGTSTAFVGELSDLLTGVALAIPAGIIYKKHRTFKGALVAMAVGTACLVVIALIVNRIILVPYYVAAFFGGNWDGLLGFMTPLFPSITKETFYAYYLWVSVLPFNLLRCLVAVLITLPVYKRISILINRTSARLEPKVNEDGQIVGEQRAKKIQIVVIVVAAVIVAVLALFAVLQACGVFKS